MEDRVYYGNLFDYYGGLLTTIQQTYFKEYYFNNLSLEEIAINYEVSRAAISKALIEVKEKLEYYESSLHLLNNKDKITSILNKEELKKIEKYI